MDGVVSSIGGVVVGSKFWVVVSLWVVVGVDGVVSSIGEVVPGSKFWVVVSLWVVVGVDGVVSSIGEVVPGSKFWVVVSLWVVVVGISFKASPEVAVKSKFWVVFSNAPVSIFVVVVGISAEVSANGDSVEKLNSVLVVVWLFKKASKLKSVLAFSVKALVLIVEVVSNSGFISW